MTWVSFGPLNRGTVILDTTWSGASGERVTNRHSGLVMDVQIPNLNSNARVGLYAWNGENWQRWAFEDPFDKCLDVSDTADGSEIQQYDCYNGTNQQFTLRSTSNEFLGRLCSSEWFSPWASADADG